MKTFLGLAIAFTLFASSGVAHADDVSEKVQKALRGQILITNSQLPPPGETDAQTINAYKKARATSLAGTDVDGVSEWAFLFTAFLKKAPKTQSLSLEFYTDDKEKLFVADKRFEGVDPKGTILSGQVNISSDDGPTKGRKYIIKLVGKVKRKDVVFAQTKLTLK